MSACIAHAAPVIISPSTWEVTGITGEWDYATSGWWLSDSNPDISTVDALMSDGYTHYPSAYTSPINGIDAFPNPGSHGLEFSFDSDVSLNGFELWVTRMQSTGLTVSFDYQ